MAQTLSAPGVAAILDFTMVPWGNAYFNTTLCGTTIYEKEPKGMYCWVKQCNVANPPSDCFSGFTWCQHGDDECAANRLEACVINYFPDPAKYYKFMSCYEDGSSSFQKCASAAGIPKQAMNSIQACSQDGSRIGDSLQVANAKATAKLGSSKLGTPWVIVNGKYLDEPDNLLQTVCSEYTGPTPKGCA